MGLVISARGALRIVQMDHGSHEPGRLVPPLKKILVARFTCPALRLLRSVRMGRCAGRGGGRRCARARAQRRLRWRSHRLPCALQQGSRTLPRPVRGATNTYVRIPVPANRPGTSFVTDCLCFHHCASSAASARIVCVEKADDAGVKRKIQRDAGEFRPRMRARFACNKCLRADTGACELCLNPLLDSRRFLLDAFLRRLVQIRGPCRQRMVQAVCHCVHGVPRVGGLAALPPVAKGCAKCAVARRTGAAGGRMTSHDAMRRLRVRRRGGRRAGPALRIPSMGVIA